MSDHPSPKDVLDAYIAITRDTRYPPNLMVVPGSLILQERPDLVGEIDPNKAYYVTKDSIVEVTEENML